MVETTPTLPVTDMAAATAFYEAAGFQVHAYSEGFAFAHYEDVSVFDLGHEDVDPASNKAGCFLIVPDSSLWHARLSAASLPVSPIEDMPWGMREFTLTDLDGNRVRIGTPIQA